LDKELATELLKNFLERATSSGEKAYLTSREISALGALLDIVEPAPATVGASRGNPPPSEPKRVRLEQVDDQDVPQNLMMCIDFGTSFSKAFASVHDGGSPDVIELIDLPIGDGTTGLALTTQSELFIDDGHLYFGPAARRRFEDTQASPDRLIDSIKQFITLNSDVTSLNLRKLSPAQDPSQSFSQRDILVLFLGHLMSRAEGALAAKGLSPNARRRFTHPAWKEDTRVRNEAEMRRMMAEAVVLSRGSPDELGGYIAISEARDLLDQLKILGSDQLPLTLIHDPVREATAAGAGAILATPERHREHYLVVDVGAGTTDVAGFICVNNPDWERPRLFEVVGAASAKAMAGNVLDNALQKLVLERSLLVPESEEYATAGMELRRNRRAYKEQLFNEGRLTVPLTTDENVTITLDDFLAYDRVVRFNREITDLVARSAVVVAGDLGRINLVATGGGSSLPIFRELAAKGVAHDGKHVDLVLVDAIADGVRETNPDLVDPYPQIAVALGGSLPTLPEPKGSVAQGITSAPKLMMSPIYKS
jgi:molecular chaperone DnaK (HSP70)